MNNQNINPKSLKGKDVFNRALDLMNKLTPINESVINASMEFVKKAPNGLVYTIIRENHKYFIKSTDKLEFKISELDYSGGLKNKMTEAYSSYEEALKHLNMKFQQLNEIYDIRNGYNLFEQDVLEAEEVTDDETGVKEKKYKLKVKPEEGGETEEVPSAPSEEIPLPQGETPSIEDVPASPEGEAPEGEAPEGEAPEGLPGGESPEGETPEDSEDDMDIEDDDEEDPKKYVQKLTGRLGQKLRELSEVDPKLEKYVINSIISALHVDKMDKKDRMDVIRKFKKKKGMESMMKESFSMDEYYGMMSLENPLNYEKIDTDKRHMKMGTDEDNIESHPKKHRPLRFKKFELGMDEELYGGQHKLDLNKNGKLDSEDFRMLRSKKKNSDEGKFEDQETSNKLSDRKERLKDAIRRIKNKKRSSDERFNDEIKFHSSKDERWGQMDPEIETDYESEKEDLRKHEDELDRILRRKGIDIDREKSGPPGQEKEPVLRPSSNKPEKEKNPNQPDVMDPDIDTPLAPPVPRRQNPFEPNEPENDPMVRPKMGNDEPEVMDPDIDIEEPLTPPKPRRQNPLDPGNPENDPMVRPKMGNDNVDPELESLIRRIMKRK